MKITSTALAWVCVALLVLYPVSAILVWAYLSPESYGIMAALFAANAGTALFIGFTFRLPEFRGHTSRALRFFVVFIAVVCGLIVSNQQKWDTLGAERSGAGWRSGELPEGPVVASSPFGGLSLHLLPAL